LADRLIDKLRDFLRDAEGKEVSLRYLRDELRLNPERPEWESIRQSMRLLEKQAIIKSTGRNDGTYKVLRQVKPVPWWDGNNAEPLNFRFPRAYDDGSEFGIEDLVEVFAGDMILIAGASNYWKTGFALSLLGENLDLFPLPRLMGSEYTAADGKISPKFKRRLNRMEWVKWLTEDGKPRFELYPVGADYEDYIKPDTLNIIDWISLPGEYYLIDRVTKTMKDRVGNGVIVGVIQKNRATEFGEGGERTERYADIYITIDPFGEKGSQESLLTLGKVKSPKGKATGKTWVFSVVDYGANLHNIREVVKCTKCYGRGYVRSGQNNIRCSLCLGKKYIDNIPDF